VFGQELTYGKRFTAIEYAENGNFNLLQLVKKKKELQISKKDTLNNFDAVISAFKGQKHCFLIINDEHVLSKKIAVTNSDEKTILRTAFPNITISDFYYEMYSNESDSFVAIARKNIVDDIIKTYQKGNISVIDFSLGNLAVKNLQPFIDNEKLFSSNAKIHFEQNEINGIKKQEVSNEQYLINDLKVSNKEVLPLAGIISYYTKNATSSIQKELKDQYIQKRFFDVGLKAGLGFLLIVLLLNFLFFSHYRNEINTLNAELQLSESYKIQLNNYQKLVIQKKQLVKSVQSASNSKLSQYIDELGMTTPQTVLLSLIAYQPIAGIQKKDKPLLFQKNKIIVKGISKEDADFSNWISTLEKKPWIENISINEYGKGNRRKSISNFEFIITLND
jgi:Tfp pilus assembly protein PilN